MPTFLLILEFFLLAPVHGAAALKEEYELEAPVPDHELKSLLPTQLHKLWPESAKDTHDSAPSVRVAPSMTETFAREYEALQEEMAQIQGVVENQGINMSLMLERTLLQQKGQHWKAGGVPYRERPTCCPEYQKGEESKGVWVFRGSKRGWEFYKAEGRNSLFYKCADELPTAPPSEEGGRKIFENGEWRDCGYRESRKPENCAWMAPPARSRLLDIENSGKCPAKCEYLVELPEPPPAPEKPWTSQVWIYSKYRTEWLASSRPPYRWQNRGYVQMDYVQPSMYYSPDNLVKNSLPNKNYRYGPSRAVDIKPVPAVDGQEVTNCLYCGKSGSPRACQWSDCDEVEDFSSINATLMTSASTWGEQMESQSGPQPSMVMAVAASHWLGAPAFLYTGNPPDEAPENAQAGEIWHYKDYSLTSKRASCTNSRRAACIFEKRKEWTKLTTEMEKECPEPYSMWKTQGWTCFDDTSFASDSRTRAAISSIGLKSWQPSPAYYYRSGVTEPTEKPSYAQRRQFRLDGGVACLWKQGAWVGKRELTPSPGHVVSTTYKPWQPPAPEEVEVEEEVQPRYYLWKNGISQPPTAKPPNEKSSKYWWWDGTQWEAKGTRPAYSQLRKKTEYQRWSPPAVYEVQEYYYTRSSQVPTAIPDNAKTSPYWMWRDGKWEAQDKVSAYGIRRGYFIKWDPPTSKTWNEENVLEELWYDAGPSGKSAPPTQGPSAGAPMAGKAWVYEYQRWLQLPASTVVQYANKKMYQVWKDDPDDTLPKQMFRDKKGSMPAGPPTDIDDIDDGQVWVYKWSRWRKRSWESVKDLVPERYAIYLPSLVPKGFDPETQPPREAKSGYSWIWIDRWVEMRTNWALLREKLDYVKTNYTWWDADDDKPEETETRVPWSDGGENRIKVLVVADGAAFGKTAQDPKWQCARNLNKISLDLFPDTLGGKGKMFPCEVNTNRDTHEPHKKLMHSIDMAKEDIDMVIVNGYVPGKTGKPENEHIMIDWIARHQPDVMVVASKGSHVAHKMYTDGGYRGGLLAINEGTFESYLYDNYEPASADNDWISTIPAERVVIASFEKDADPEPSDGLNSSPRTKAMLNKLAEDPKGPKEIFLYYRKGETHGGSKLHWQHSDHWTKKGQQGILARLVRVAAGRLPNTINGGMVDLALEELNGPFKSEREPEMGSEAFRDTNAKLVAYGPWPDRDQFGKQMELTPRATAPSQTWSYQPSRPVDKTLPFSLADIAEVDKGDPVTVFHGTSWAAAKHIVNTGIDLTRSNGFSGKGFYLSLAPEDAIGYACSTIKDPKPDGTGSLIFPEASGDPEALVAVMLVFRVRNADKIYGFSAAYGGLGEAGLKTAGLTGKPFEGTDCVDVAERLTEVEVGGSKEFAKKKPSFCRTAISPNQFTIMNNMMGEDVLPNFEVVDVIKLGTKQQFYSRNRNEKLQANRFAQPSEDGKKRTCEAAVTKDGALAS